MRSAGKQRTRLPTFSCVTPHRLLDVFPEALASLRATRRFAWLEVQARSNKTKKTEKIIFCCCYTCDQMRGQLWEGMGHNQRHVMSGFFIPRSLNTHQKAS
ncbi:hypothetical protein TNIN_92521 [Trichonephila inaurata madagascariensis]|uniref:Uncharacterized protein n=1 Tax=Trichonephila inaurata madagascariensis TaxID=2747483 RepID=A0A8X6YIT0_9ARAC|nr:hypothetical protein TNIN_92521 [Trichonephila inaurata madagascariensis]